jgi:diguanylate cyclase (GGDEF)-like protein
MQAWNSLEQARVWTLRRGMRIVATVASVQGAGYVAMLAVQGDLLVPDRPGLAMPLWLAMLLLTSWLAMRPGEMIGSSAQAAGETGLLGLAVMMMAARMAPVGVTGHGMSHVATLPLLMAVSTMMPLPARLGVPVLGAIAAGQVAGQLAFFASPLLSYSFGVLCVNQSLALGMAMVMMHIHNLLFENAWRSERSLSEVADQDHLTRLPNRQAIEYRLRRLFLPHGGRRWRGLVLVDVDRFREVNRRWGHATGDAVLRHLGRRLRRTLATEPGMQVGRLGGEEFVVLVEEGGTGATARTAALLVDQVAARPFQAGGLQVRVTVSSGWAVRSTDAPGGWRGLLADAERALRLAKAAGGNRAVSFQEARASEAEPDRPDIVEGYAALASPMEAAFVRSERQRLHVSLLALFLLLAVFWVPLQTLYTWSTALTHGNAWRFQDALVLHSVATLGLLGGFGWLLWSPAARRNVGVVHALGLLASSAGVGLATTPGGTDQLTAAITTEIALLCSWSVALSVTRPWSLAVPVLAAGLFLGLLGPQAWMHADVVDPAGFEAWLLLCSLFLGLLVTVVARQQFGMLRDEESLVRYELALRSSLDTLTRLPNRMTFAHALDTAHQALQRRDPTVVGMALLLLDMDRFKAVNDTAGHHVGDRALKAVGEALQGCLDRRHMVARLGGEEFGVLLQQVRIGEAREVAERVLDRIRHLEVRELPVRLSASVGVALGCAGEELDEWLGRADMALQQARREGRDRAVIHVGPCDGGA